MLFLFPDSQDQIDPSFDLVTEERLTHRVRQRDDRYAHEVLDELPYDGLLVSKPIVDGTATRAGKYTLTQRQRLYRVGAHAFLRLDRPDGQRLLAMGDCGAFSYVGEDYPPYSVDEVIDFYDGCQMDLGISVDHVILDFDADGTAPREKVGEWRRRQRLTLDLASDFLRRTRARRCRFTPYGVAQGWSPKTMARAVADLQSIGYRHIALGGMVALRTSDVLACLAAISDVRDARTRLHLLGVTRSDHFELFRNFGVVSFDSTSPFRQAFMDETDNYYVLDGAYVAIRVPQVDANTVLKRKIAAGQIDQRQAIAVERRCLELLRAYDSGSAQLNAVLTSLVEFEAFHSPKRSRAEDYRRTLESRPWQHCACEMCRRHGIEVVIFRGAERNKRRGFHNLAVFRERLTRGQRRRNMMESPVDKVGDTKVGSAIGVGDDG